MKKILLFIFFCSLSVQSQNMLLDILPLKGQKVVYTKVHEVVDASKLRLSQNAEAWFQEHQLAIERNQALDERHHQIEGELQFQELWGPNDFPELYKTIYCKVGLTLINERYQYQISNFIVKEPQSEIQLEIYKVDKKKLQKYNPDFYKRIDVKIKSIIASLEVKMME